MIHKRSIAAFTLVVLALLQLSTQKTFPRLPLEVIQVMGSKAMRYHHFLWHNLRELWPTIDNATQKAIADLGWEPPRPSLKYAEDGTSTANEENFSGEDFLYMHKQMVKETNRILAEVNGPYQKVVGFPQFPAPNDPDYPVPCNYTIPGEGNVGFTQLIVGTKTDDFYYNTIVPTEKAVKDPENLRKMNLGQLGSRLEYSVHQWMHLRFSKKTPYDIRVPAWNPVPEIDEKWEDLSYQWLADTFSSQVNPIFWRIHGWVEDRLEDWRVANGLDEIPWEHTWEGGPASTISDLFAVGLKSDLAKQDPSPPVNEDGDNRLLQEEEDHMGMHNVKTMEQVIQLLMTATGCKESSIYKKVNVTPFTSM